MLGTINESEQLQSLDESSEKESSQEPATLKEKGYNFQKQG